MIERLIQEWSERGIGVLIIGGQVMLAEGLRELTKDLDACLTAKQCPRMLDWLSEKSRQGMDIQIRAGSAPLHADWLSRGWTFHIEIDETDRVDFFGIPFRAPQRLIRRFDEDPRRTEHVSLVELGYLKRTERPRDWADIELLLGRFRERNELDASLAHMFGDSLAERLLAERDRAEFRKSVLKSQQAKDRPILRLGLFASEDDLFDMAGTELEFVRRMGSMRTREIRTRLKAFWSRHGQTIRGHKDFAACHTALFAAARADLPLSPVGDPVALIERAREQSGANRWPGLLPESRILASQYFPEFSLRGVTQMKDEPPKPRPFTEYLSPEEREHFARSLDEVLLEHWGPDRFEAYRARFTPPAWLAAIPKWPERDEDGRLPGLPGS